MPIVTEFDQEHGHWVLTPMDTFNLDDVVETIEKHDWSASSRYLWDLRDLQQGPDAPTELREAAAIVDRTRELWSGSRAAIVVARDFHFGIARTFQVFAEGVGVTYEIFRDLDAARQWLNASDTPR